MFATDGRMLTRVETMHLGHFTHLPRRLGYAITQQNGVTLINCGLNSSMFNIVFGGLEQPSEGDMTNVMQTFNGQPFAWWIPPSQKRDTLEHLLQTHGLTQEAREEAMVCDLTTCAIPAPRTALRVHKVETRAQLQDFTALLSVYDAAASRFYEPALSVLQKSDEHLFVGCAAGQPVVIGSLYCENHTAGLFGLITDAALRGRGYGTDMMSALLRFANKNGARYVTLSSSSDGGYRIYERLGFETLGAFACFEYTGHPSSCDAPL